MRATFEQLYESVTEDANIEDLNKVWHYVVKNRSEFTANQIRFLNERLNEIGTIIINNQVECADAQLDFLIIKIADSRKDLDRLNEVYDYAETLKSDFSYTDNNYINRLFLECYTDLVEKEKQERKRLLKQVKMQHSNKDYDPEYHTRKKALTVKNPYAEWIARGEKKIEVRSRNTKYRGELVICSAASPEIQELMSGCIMASVNLYDTKPFKDLTEEEKESTKIPRDQWEDLEEHFGWFLKDPVRMVEYPVKGQLGIFNLVMDQLEFIPYSAKERAKITELPTKPLVYNRKAVWVGAIVLTLIFVALVLMIWGIIALFR